MSGPRILVVEHQGNAGLGLMRSHLVAAGAELAIVGPDADRSGVPVPETLTGFDALIVLGGSMGPEDDADAPWLPATRRLLADAVAAGTPTLGVCLGAQLLAVATGGSVREIPQGPEIGALPVQVGRGADGVDPGAVVQDPLLSSLDGQAPLAMQWHYLEVEELPAGATRLASSRHTINQAFRVGPAAWGVQFHPEASSASAADWVVEDADGLVRLGRDAEPIMQAARAADAALADTWGGLAARFARIAARATADPHAEAVGTAS